MSSKTGAKDRRRRRRRGVKAPVPAAPKVATAPKNGPPGADRTDPRYADAPEPAPGHAGQDGAGGDGAERTGSEQNESQRNESRRNESERNGSAGTTPDRPEPEATGIAPATTEQPPDNHRADRPGRTGRSAQQRTARAARQRAARSRAVERRAMFATLASSAGFAVLLVLVAIQWAPLVGMDRSVATWWTTVVTPGSWLADFFVAVQAISQPWVLRAAAVVVAAFVIRAGYRRLGLWLIGAVTVGTLLEWFIKALVARPRPPVARPVSEPHGYSFPSGHALMSSLVAVALVIVALRLRVRTRGKVAAIAAAGGTILLVGLDRVALSVHYVSDVLAAWILAPALLGATVLAFGLGRPRDPSGDHEPERPRRRVAVVLNPSKVDDATDFRNQVERTAQRGGWEPPEWFETSVDDPGHAMTKAALAAEVDLVIAAGGDGTVRVVCSELADSGVPVGIVPAGTGNLLVRNLGLPLDLREAIEVAFTGSDRRLDLVRVEGDSLETDRFAVMAGLGLDAAVVGEAPAKLKRRVGWAAYAVSIVRNLSFPALRVDIAVDDEPPVRRYARTVLVGNVGTLHGGLELLPEAEPDDGMLDVVAVAPRRLTEWPHVAWRVARRSKEQDERLHTWRGRRVVVTAAEEVPRQLDGDVIESGRELRCEIEPGVLLIRMPSTERRN
ncbi:diacylglycerol kinase family protein [Actinopolymorpha rutila]|uniref:YegS/Rv2252/BmrU family lipid kinase n=1 Tax=Actinopolymorpha rutila TaxID=446787 RepID=A0A852ZF44_9ACTN|nr:YegS/Rv2252/BmrU family lipid kinase [Actinopolymorpha rutila]